MSSGVSEVTEEDAAILQFPKGHQRKPLSCCLQCNQSLSLPFIQCAVCNVDTCLTCFANGVCFLDHTSDHPYRVMHANFPLFKADWTAQEENMLLDHLELRATLADKPHTLNKNFEDCIDHYSEVYLNAMPALCATGCISTKDTKHPEPRPQITGTLNPPRPELDSSFYKDMSGYVAGRGDFVHEFKDNAEQDVALMDDLAFDTVETSLKAAVVSVYNSVLKERFLRKKVIREHGLMNPHTCGLAMARYSSILTKSATATLMKFAQLLQGIELDKIMEGLHAAVVCKRKLKEMKQMRSLGMTSLSAISVYQKGKNLRFRAEREYKQMPDFSFSKIDKKLGNLQTMGPIRGIPMRNVPKSSAPLILVGLPGYEKLNSEEQELCSTLRILPQLYLKFKETLMQKCHDRDGMTLMQARSLVRIDVNKTRCVFNLLEKMGCIYRPKNSKMVSKNSDDL